MTMRLRAMACVCAVALLPTVGSASAAAPPLDRVGFAPPAGATLPLQARFVDEHGAQVQLARYVGSHPAIVVPAYYGCSNLCSTVLRGVASSLGATSLRPGRDVEIVVVSIDPLDSPAVALAKKRELLGAAPAGDAWHFLTGDERAIGRFADSLGYRYAYDDAGGQFAHAAGIVVAAPGGRIARVLYGATFPPGTLREAVRAAGPAQVASTGVGDQPAATWLLCFHYDPQTGRYSFAAMNAVRAAGLAALLALAGYIVRARLRERRMRGRANR